MLQEEGTPRKMGAHGKEELSKLEKEAAFPPKTSGLPRDSEKPLKMLKGNSVWAAGNGGHVTLPYDPNLEVVFFNREVRYCLHFFSHDTKGKLILLEQSFYYILSNFLWKKKHFFLRDTGSKTSFSHILDENVCHYSCII